MIPNNIGILLTNIGTPGEPTPNAVRHFLKKFLNDKRVVEIPRVVWWPLLYGLILPFRSNRSAKLYQSIWTHEGSPLLVYSQKIAKKLQEQLQIPVVLGMHYSAPSIETALTALKAKNVSRIIVLPLYPQYSGTTTASTFDAIAAVLKKWRVIPELGTINHYATHPCYIQTICSSIRQYWAIHGIAKHLLFSFHSIPQCFIDAGDPYQLQCQQTAELVAKELQLPPSSWSISFQSRLGRAKWISPYTETVLKSLPQQNIKDLHVICPGFATDCLETLEEINIRGKQQFMEAGGNSFYYIPALNDSDEHIKMLKEIIGHNCHLHSANMPTYKLL